MPAISAAQWPEGRLEPDEPYRYACPDCESVRVGQDEEGYGCVNCGGRFDEVLDRKRDELVRP